MDRKGLTMTEVIVAVLIIAILSGGMFSAFCGAEHFINRARHRMQAFNFALEALDRLKGNYTYTDSTLDAGSGYSESEIGSILRGELSNLSAALTYDVTESEPDGYKEVTVHVNWNEPSL